MFGISLFLVIKVVIAQKKFDACETSNRAVLSEQYAQQNNIHGNF